MPDLSKTAEPIEVYITVLALLGTVLIFSLLYQALLDAQVAWGRRGLAVDRLTAASGIINEGLRLLCMLAILAVGVVALLSPNTGAGEPAEPTVLAAAVYWAFLAIEHALLVKSIASTLMRRAVQRAVEQDAEALRLRQFAPHG